VNLSDPELLRRFLDERAEDALGEIVRRYLDLVYSAALRQVGGDAHFAEDVAQQVFADFVRKAGRLRGRASLGGWFYTSTHYAAAKLVRGERRRKAGDLEASKMNAIEASSVSERDWEQLRAVLDHAMHELGERDRDTVLLRYFERLPLAEVGRRLGLSENAASKALERAIERLRQGLARRGITSTAIALGVALADHAVAVAPAGLAGSVTATLLSSEIAAATAVTALTFMMKKIALIVGAILLLMMSGIAYYKTLKVRALEAQIAQLRMDNLPVVPRRGTTATTRSAGGAAGGAKAATPAARAPANEPGTNRIEQIRNAGRGTPEDAYVTFYWAMEQGDVKLLAEDIAYDDDAKAIFQKMFDELSAEARDFYGTPEIMGAAVGCTLNKIPVQQLEIVGAKESGPDAVMLSYRRGEDRTERFIPMVRGDDGWKVVGRGALFMDRARAEAFFKAAEELAAEAKRGESRVKMPVAPGAIARP
jgi:RNA polymerase sigma factor (sigma-70 family)